MTLSKLADSLWGRHAKLSHLLLVGLFLLSLFLGARDIWTQEHRWADIVSGMFYRHDFLHPYLGQNDYYDKPLLSYWLMALVAKISGGLTLWALRLPSVLAGLLALWSVYRLGLVLKDRSLGLLAGWLLLTTFYFVFWARTSSADMLNLAGSIFAVAWYFEKREHASGVDYAMFFAIIALTSLCKGLVGAVVPLIAVLVDVLLRKSWRQYMRWSVFVALMPALIIYALPFWASSYFSDNSYHQDGLYLVYRENILRYFQPFDHQGPIYTYLLFLPIYLLPWAVFFIPALMSVVSRWRSMNVNSQWLVYTLGALFLFFTLSGSRRSYYVLPMVPFAILFTADWVASSKTRVKWSAGAVVVTVALLLLVLDILPAWYFSRVGAERFAQTLRAEAVKLKPWSEWHVVMLDAESKLNFYLQLPPTTQNFQIKGTERQAITAMDVVHSWPILESKPANTIFITRKMYVSMLRPYFSGYRLVELPSLTLPVVKNSFATIPVAFIPVS